MELPGKRELREQILHQMDGRTSYVSDKDVYREIDKAILRSSHGGYGTLSEKEELRRQMFYSIRGFDVLEKYLGDSSISEIMVIGASRIFVEQNGKIRRIEEHFSEEGDVYRLIEQIVAPTNRMVNEACPIVDSRLPDGSRVHIVLPPVSLEGPVITIRKFLKGGMTIEKLLAFEEFPEKLTGILSALVKSRYNILISGATNSGKSSLLNALAEYIGKRERVITIEDSAELQLFHVENLVRLETRNANMEGENEITMQDLIKASLRMRPDRIIVGEVRGAEAMSMLQALSTGHSGSVSSIHANSCRDALRRLETMVLMGMDMPLAAIQGLDLHITLEQLFMEFAESTGLEEAKQFAVVIEIVRSTGGNMVEILKRTMQHLKYKMDTEEEIRVLLSGKLFEKNIMLSMPFFILLYLRLANPEYVECFYNTILGHLVMSGMIGITVFCFFWSEKIMNIRF